MTPAFNAAPMAPNMMGQMGGAQMGPGTPAGGAVAPPMGPPRGASVNMAMGVGPPMSQKSRASNRTIQGMEAQMNNIGQNLDTIQNQQGFGSQAGGMYQQQPMGGSQMGYQQFGGSQMGGSQGGMAPMAGGTPMGSQPPGPSMGGSQAGGDPAAANAWTNAIG